jgi:peptide deformylase
MRILRYPTDLVPIRCEIVDSFDDGLRQTVAHMLDVLRRSRGDGISAPQVGVNKRILAVDPKEDGRGLTVMVNPRALWTSRELTLEHESCLSIPSVLIPLKRPSWIEVEHQTVMGEKVTTVFGGWTARLIQHELDHLDGMVMLDHLDDFERDLIRDCCAPSKQ